MLMRARVFISCGQNKDTDELTTAKAIADGLEQLGFDPYIAVDEQTLLGLTENIFARLASSEYFVFVDFKREQLANSADCRGSPFSHQELAIASFLKLEVLAFQERGVRLDGMMRLLQVNCIPFANRQELPAMVMDSVPKRGWRSDWRNELSVERDQDRDSELKKIGKYEKGTRNVFAATVRNCHNRRPAAHTFIYLDHIEAEAGGSVPPLRTVELKWLGYDFPNALIRPSASRSFECCWIDPQQPSVANFNVFTDKDEYRTHIQGPGRFRLRYTALAENFSPASLDLELVLGNAIEDVALGAVPQ